MIGNQINKIQGLIDRKPRITGKSTQLLIIEINCWKRELV